MNFDEKSFALANPEEVSADLLKRAAIVFKALNLVVYEHFFNTADEEQWLYFVESFVDHAFLKQLSKVCRDNPQWLECTKDEYEKAFQEWSWAFGKRAEYAAGYRRQQFNACPELERLFKCREKAMEASCDGGGKGDASDGVPEEKEAAVPGESAVPSPAGGSTLPIDDGVPEKGAVGVDGQ